jgi:hypothetical protein
MPFGDARDFVEWSTGGAAATTTERMTPDDFREMRRRMGAGHG